MDVIEGIMYRSYMVLTSEGSEDNLKAIATVPTGEFEWEPWHHWFCQPE